MLTNSESSSSRKANWYLIELYILGLTKTERAH